MFSQGSESADRLSEIYGKVTARIGTLTAMQTSVIFWIFVILPIFTLIIVRVALLWLRRTARQAVIQVKKMKEVVSEGHFLDLDPKFVEDMRQNDRYCRVTSLASYLASLDYGGNQDVGYRIISTLAAALAGDSLMPLIPLVPASVIPKESALKTSGLLARFTLTEFPSILTLAAIVDSATQFTKQEKKDENSLPLPPDAVDAMDLLARGEKPGSLIEVSESLLRAEKLHFCSRNTLRLIVEKEMNLGESPDRKRYEFPRPFSPSLLPGLCIGNGGLEMTVTPRMMCQNRLLAIILNKLAANVMGWCEFGPFNRANESSETYPQFTVYVGEDEEEAKGNPIYTCSEFIHALMEKGGGSCKASIRTNLTAFGLGLCVLDEDAAALPVGETIDFTDGSKRFQYTQIPLAFCSRTGVVCPFTGSSVHQLSAHSAVEWHFIGNKFLGTDEVNVTFYTGVEGFTGFKPGGEWDRPWVRCCDRIRDLSYEEGIQALDLAACEAVCSNICVRLWKFPFGGYGGLGVCADSVAMIEHALRGRTTIFPLFMRGDAKNGLLYVMREHIRPRILSSLGDHARFNEKDVRQQKLSEFLDLMGRIARTLIRLPNDIQVEPHEILDSLDRISNCTMGSPFHGDQVEVHRLKTIRDGWGKALKEFETDFAEVGKAKLQALDRQQKVLPGFYTGSTD